jgi:hypothetical protein
MATYDSTLSTRAPWKTHEGAENFFFAGMSFLLLVTALVGFARSYFLAGMIRAHLPNLLIHIHAIAFTSWIVLLVTQAMLIAGNREDLHRKLGWFGFGLATLMVALGVMAATDALTRISSFHGIDEKTFYAVPMLEIVAFGTLAACAFVYRHNPAAHKRFILVATIAIIDAAGGRPPLTSITRLPYLNDVFTQAYLIMLAGFDLWSLGKIHRATIIAGVLAISAHLFAIPVGRTHAWIAFANWAMHLATRIHS